MGSVNRKSMPVKRELLKYIRHERYNKISFKNDIAAIEMMQPVEFNDNLKPINLPKKAQSSSSFVGIVMTVSGFGRTNENNDPEKLQFTTMMGISKNDCRELYTSLIVNTTLCTVGYPNKKQAGCTGDSGGPLIQTFTNKPSVLIGLVSFGNGCGIGNPEAFSRVPMYLDWIHDHTGISVS